ncbi:site-specific integrase [Paracraurococcus lichenis]|uniref:Tyr recombinase domain-containing protein n=1 Tax=Paracraurococcus lichenis TaxID=3064888 RepID=A0ABT9E3L1_9PROT|nr:hypothetical protein [Paracraurococcus sp. LOR1-02]MDO9710754.1 hypothetical protein [Paracraurococcus sp. LOR1-02]
MTQSALSVVSNRHANVVLADGRTVRIDLSGNTSISNDQRRHYFDFTWRDEKVAWQNSLALVLVSLIKTHSLSYASSCTYVTSQFVRALQQDRNLKQELEAEDLAIWPEKVPMIYWGFFRAVLNRWIDSSHQGIGESIRRFLDQPEQFEEQGKGWYFALVANDPERGALTEQELRSIRDGVNQAFEVGRISLSDWTLVWFLIGTGVRAVQIARTKISDVEITAGPEGNEITLGIPLAKGENVVVHARWKRKSPSVLTEVLLRYLESPDVRDLPTSSPLFEDQSQKIQRRIADIFRKVQCHSERLNGPIPIFPYRFRYTLGTRAIALGASDHEVARLLTHRTTHCIRYYRAAMPTLQAPIKQALGQEMTFLANAFQGHLIPSLEQATRRGEPGAVIRDFAHLMGQSLGACGTRAECHLNAPRACLVCRKFEPLRDAPWEQFLDSLLEDLAEETEDRIRLITQEQIEAVREIMAERDGKALETAT